MKWLLVGLAVLTALGCRHSQPETRTDRFIGMSVEGYRHSCGKIRMSQKADLTVADCLNRPREYAIFNAGAVTAVVDRNRLAIILEPRICGETPAQTCSDGLRQALAEQEDEKVALLENITREKRAAELKGFADAVAAGTANQNAMVIPPPVYITPAQIQPTPQPQGAMCFYKRQAVSNMNKICFYDCLGSITTTNVTSYALCPLNIYQGG